MNAKKAPVLLDLREVCERIPSLSIHTLRRWATQRRIPTVRLSRRVFILAADLDALIARGREEARSDLAV